MTPNVQTIQQLFVHELQDAFAAEQALVGTLERLSQEQTTQELQQVFRDHLAETHVHLDRLSQIFSTLGVQPAAIRCDGMDGIVQEHDRFVQEHQPAPQVHAVFDVGAGQRVERYEIATYETLVRLANTLGMYEAAGLLQTTLSDERQQLRRLENVGTSTLARSEISHGSPGQSAPTQQRQSGSMASR